MLHISQAVSSGKFSKEQTEQFHGLAGAAAAAAAGAPPSAAPEAGEWAACGNGRQPPPGATAEPTGDTAALASGITSCKIGG